MMQFSLSKVLIGTGILFHLLFSFYFYEIGLAPFALLSAIFLSYFCFTNYKRYRSYLSSGYLNLGLLLLLIVFSVIVSALVCATEGFTFYPASFLGIILDFGLFLGLVGLGLNLKLKRFAYLMFWGFFLISLALFVAQAIAWYGLGVELDFLANFTGEEQRLIGHQMYVAGITTRRVSGIFAEPALYCWVMVGLAHFLFGSFRESKRKGLLFVAFLAYLTTILFSFSLSGWILAFGSILVTLVGLRKPSLILAAVIGMAVLVFAFFPYVEAYWYGRVLDLSGDGSLNDRLSVWSSLETILSNPLYLIFGVGVATRVEISALSFLASSILLFGVIGSFYIGSLIFSFVFRLPGTLSNKLFICSYILFFGNHITSTINWFVFGGMTFLMIANFTRNSNTLRRGVRSV